MNDEISGTEDSEAAINGILLIGRLTLESQMIADRFTPPNSLMEIARLLHGILPSIPSHKDSVKNNISKVSWLFANITT